jgi:hypothetical protein
LQFKQEQQQHFLRVPVHKLNAQHATRNKKAASKAELLTALQPHSFMLYLLQVSHS